MKTTKTKTEETERLKANTKEYVEMSVFKEYPPEESESEDAFAQKLKAEMADLDLEDPNVLIAFLKRWEERFRGYAVDMHKTRLIYLIYGLFDGLNISYSLLKLIFDLIFAKLGGKSDAMHEWTLTPAGIAATAAESITLITFAMLANYFKDDDPHRLKRLLATYWPYLRDVFKSTKNSYKGFSSTIKAVKTITGHNYSSLIFPVGLAIGAVSMCCRLTLRTLISKRKDLMDGNAKLLQDIQNKQFLTEEEARAYRKLISQVYREYRGIDSDKKEVIYRVGRQSTLDRVAGLTAAAVGSVVDSLYLYMGALGICALSGPFMGVMMGFCTILALTCVVTRVYEEFDFQRRLVIRQDRIEMAITSKEYARDMQVLIEELNDLSMAAAMEPNNEKIRQKGKLKRNEIKDKIAAYTAKRKELQSKSLLSDTSAVLDGMKNGLAAYSAIASGMFAIYTILTLCSVSFPPALLASFVILGLVAVVGFTLYSYYQHRDYREKIEEEADEPYERLIDFIQIPKAANAEANRVAVQKIPELFDDYMLLDPGPRNFIPINSEAGRSLLTGPPKGFKLIEFTMNPLRKKDENGDDCHDSKLILGFSIVSSVVYAVVMALRAYVRGYGRPDDFYMEHLVFKDLKAKEQAAKNTPASDESVMDDFMELLPTAQVPAQSDSNTILQLVSPSLTPDTLVVDLSAPPTFGGTGVNDDYFGEPLIPSLEETVTTSQPPSPPAMRRSVSMASQFSFFKVARPRSQSLSELPQAQLSVPEKENIHIGAGIPATAPSSMSWQRKRSSSAIENTIQGSGLGHCTF